MAVLTTINIPRIDMAIAQLNYPALKDEWKQALRLICFGLSNPEIANILNVSIKTVERYLTEVYTILGVSGSLARSEAILIVFGIVQPHE